MIDRAVDVDSLRDQSTDIFHEHHHVRLVEVTARIGTDRELDAAVDLGDREGNQVSEWIGDRSGILEYLFVQLLSS